jgi:AraC-like DNA-binding protein
LFEAEGTTVSAWIRERRLECCRIELIATDLADQSVSEIGTRWGFWDAAHFSRLFKSRFGVSPSAYRSASLEPHKLEETSQISA